MRPLLIPLLLLCTLIAAKDSRPKCDRSLIKGVIDSEVEIKFTETNIVNSMKCPRPKSTDIRAIVFNSVPYERLECDRDQGWSGIFENGTSKLIAKPYTPLRVACKEYCAVTGEGITFNKVSPGIAMRCEDHQKRLFFGGKRALHDRVECGLDEGWHFEWMRNDRLEHDHSKPLQLECKSACDYAMIEGVEADEVEFEFVHKNTFIVKCRRSVLEDSLRAIWINSVLYETIDCSVYSGWTVGNNLETLKHLAKYDSFLNAACVEYCTVKGHGIASQLGRDSRIVWCNNDQVKWRQMYYQGSKVQGYLAKCTREDGWYTNAQGGSMLKGQDHLKPLQLECRTGPPVCDLSLVKGVTADKIMFESDDNGYTKRLRCRNKASSLSAIVFHSKRYEYLECNLDKGWKDLGLAADSEITVSCEEYCIAAGTELIAEVSASSLVVGCKDQIKQVYSGQAWGGQGAKCGLAGWQGFADHDITRPLPLECRKNLCSFHPSQGLQFDDVSKTLTCAGAEHSVRSIEINSRLYKSLTCSDVDGWKVYRSQRKVTVASNPAKFTCVEFCVAEGEAISSAPSDIGIVVFCENDYTMLVGKGYAERVFCSKKTGWYIPKKFNSKTLSILNDSATPMHFECLKDRPLCSYSFGDGTHKFEFDSHTNTLTCSNRENTAFVIWLGYKKIYDSLTCDEDTGWRSGKEQVAEATVALERITCMELCKPNEMTDSVIANTSAIGRDAYTTVFTCKNELEWIRIKNIDELAGTTLSCHRAGFFDVAGVKVADAYAYIQLECVAAPPPCTLKDPERMLNLKANTQNSTKILTCHNEEKSLMAVKFNSKLYKSLTCDKVDGWTAEGLKIADAVFPLPATCERYCAATGHSSNYDFKVEKLIVNEPIYDESIGVSCDKAKKLFHDDKLIENKLIGRTATCDFVHGWYNGSDVGRVLRTNTLTPMYFFCQEDTNSRPSDDESLDHPPAPPGTWTTNAPVVAAASSGDNTLLVIGGCAGGVLIIVVVIVILIFFVFKKKRPERRPESSGNATSRRAPEKGKRTKKSGSISGKSTKSEVGSVRSGQ